MPDLLTRIDEPPYMVQQTISLRCPNCGNPDCTEALAYIKTIEARTAEHQRLRLAVVEKAKEFTSNDKARDNWSALVAYRELCGAVDALIAFEKKIGE